MKCGGAFVSAVRAGTGIGIVDERGQCDMVGLFWSGCWCRLPALGMGDGTVAVVESSSHCDHGRDICR